MAKQHRRQVHVQSACHWHEVDICMVLTTHRRWRLHALLGSSWSSCLVHVLSAEIQDVLISVLQRLETNYVS
jgi:hypothetical protein